jgi:hypothetical protein
MNTRFHRLPGKDDMVKPSVSGSARGMAALGCWGSKALRSSRDRHPGGS